MNNNKRSKEDSAARQEIRYYEYVDVTENKFHIGISKNILLCERTKITLKPGNRLNYSTVADSIVFSLKSSEASWCVECAEKFLGYSLSPSKLLLTASEAQLQRNQLSIDDVNVYDKEVSKINGMFACYLATTYLPTASQGTTNKIFKSACYWASKEDDYYAIEKIYIQQASHHY